MGAEQSAPATEELTFKKKLDALKECLGIDGGTVAAVVPQVAGCLGVPTEGRTLAAIVDECYLVCFGSGSSSGAGSSSSGAGSSSGGGAYDVKIDGKTTAAELLDKLTAGEQHAECCICFDALHERPIACFTCKGKRTCAHFFHADCANELIGSGGTRPDKSHACPICRRSVDTVVKAPKASADPEGWFKCVDVESDGKLARAHVMAVLVSQFPIDHAKLEEVMPTLWERWDVDHSGFLTKEEVIGGSSSLLAMVTTHLLKEEYLPPQKPGAPPRASATGQVVRVLVPPGAAPGQQIEFVYNNTRVRVTLPPNARPGQPVMCRLPPMPPMLAPQRSFDKAPATWFATFDEDHDGKLTRDQLLRALVKTNPSVTQRRAREVIDSLGLLEGHANAVTLERFLSIHEILRSM